jgi:hypothetical protein
MATVATQSISLAGLAPAYAAADAAGDTFRPADRTFMHIKNAGTAAITATFVTPGTVQGLAVEDVAVSVPAGGERMVGPLSPELFRDRADGLGDVTWSAAASVTFAVVNI